MSLYDDFEPDPSHYAKEPPHIANRSKFAKQQAGISLRDYFAAQIIAGLSINRQGKTDEYDAKNAYLLADAMLAERNKP